MRIQVTAILIVLAPAFAKVTAGRQGPVEQTTQGTREAVVLVENFDGLRRPVDQLRAPARNGSRARRARGQDHVAARLPEDR